MNSRLSCLVAAILALAVQLPPASRADEKIAAPMWDLAALAAVPHVSPAEPLRADGMRAVFFDGVPFQGRPTRVFAWIGVPKVEPGRKVPAIVLVHGGGGTAFEPWVRLWLDRGYAAIAFDACGSIPLRTADGKKWLRHDAGGPPGWGGWEQIEAPREDQWTYHAVAAGVRAHSLLRSLPEVDAERIGVTGISWGGYLTCILAGVDSRFKFAAPVYGCGFTDRHGFAENVAKLGPEGSARWMQWWDPSMYLPAAKMPVLWVNGTNDFAYTMNAWQDSYRAAPGLRTLCLRLRMPHAHGGPGENPKEIHVFAESIVNGGAPLAKLTGQGRDGREVWATFASARPIAKAELLFTKDTGPWQKRLWVAEPAALDADGRAHATLPEGARVYFLNLTDDRDCVASSEHEELPQ
jgi:dienelactone hydrolase